MLDGWYCRSMMANSGGMIDDESSQEESKCKKEYKFLKRKFHSLIYENESLMEALRTAQKRLLTVTRDRSFLLDRLLLHEKIENSTSESEETDSSDDEPSRIEPSKKRRPEPSYNSVSGKTITSAKRRRPTVPRPKPINQQSMQQQLLRTSVSSNNLLADGHMTPEEVERHLQSQSYMELVPERAPPTVPTEMFSNEPSLDSESNDVGELETSPSNMGEDLSIDMLAE